MSKRWTLKDIERLQGQGYAATSVPAHTHRQQIKVAIGIDPGTNTGIAVWNKQDKAFTQVACTKIHNAMQIVQYWADIVLTSGLIVRLEDARQHIWFGEDARKRIQGAGSIKRDCSIWQDFLEEKGIPYELVPPKENTTKVTAVYFNRVSGWQGKTNNHARDAGMLVLNY